MVNQKERAGCTRLVSEVPREVHGRLAFAVLDQRIRTRLGEKLARGLLPIGHGAVQRSPPHCARRENELPTQQVIRWRRATRSAVEQ